MPYSGGQVNTNWLTLGYGGGSNPVMTSEAIPVIVDSVTTYSFAVTAAINTANWASGFTLTLTFYNAANGVISSVTASSAALVTGVQQVIATAPTVAPANSVTCAVQIQLNGSPAATNPLDVYKAAVLTGSNANIPDIVNYNYAFVNGTWPWVPTNSAVLNVVGKALTGANGNPDSLVIAGIIELMGGSGVPCVIPTLTDPVTGNSAIFRISTPGGQLSSLSQGSTGLYDLGDFQPTQDFVESLLLDGERPFGTRSSNRQMSIPVAIYAPTQQTLNAARDYLLSVIDQQEFEIAWTPAANGLTTIYECFRALPSSIMYGFNNLREGAPGAPAIGLVTVNIQAKPFGKSGIDGTVEIDFASGLVNGAPANSAVVLENFTGTIDTGDGWISNTQYPVIGTGCAFHRSPSPVKAPYPAVVYTSSFSAANLVGLPVLAVWLGQSYDSQWPADPKFTSNVTMSAVLTDNQARSISTQVTVPKVPWNANPTKPAWKQISLAIPQKNPKFSYNAVVSVKVTVTNWTGGGQSGYVRMNAWLGYISANPMAVTSVSSPRGILYNMYGLTGSARSAVAAQVQFPNADPIVQEFTQSGTFQVPAGVTNLQAEVWGAGGAGASVNTVIPGGGGGGGEYAVEPSVVVTPGNRIPMSIGAGGQAAALAPTVAFYRTHGVGTTWTCPANVTTATIECWAGGGAGAPGGGGGGGAGYTQNTVPVVPGTVYSMWVGAGGQPNTGTTSQALATRNGQHTWFGPSGTKAIAAAWIGAYGGTSSVAGSAAGGIGGKGRPVTLAGIGLTRAWQGGNGGRSPGGAGGGGGASGAVSGPGAAGSASPKLGSSGSGDYLTGGTGGVAPSGGGGGGNGANVPGAANGGSGPGGGGGGGYTKTVSSGSSNKAVNYQGAAGSPGQIKITYLPSSASASATASVSLVGSVTFTGTTSTLTPVGSGQIPQGSSALAVVTCATAASIFFNDLVGSVWTYVGTMSNGACNSFVFYKAGFTGNATAASITITTSLSQKYEATLYNAPLLTGFDVAAFSTGTSTAPSKAAMAQNFSGNLEVCFMSNTGANTNSVPAGWTKASTYGSGGLFTDVFWRISSSISGDACTSSYASSQAWAAGTWAFTAQTGGNPVNGGNTIFGSAATTSAVVTGHGGTSAAAGSGAGAAGGTGSSNTGKYFGGNGGLSGRNSNGLLTPKAGSVANLSVFSATNATSVTGTAGSTLSNAFMEPGVMAAVTVMSSAVLVNPVCTDTVGHVYYLAKQQALTDGTYLAAFVTSLKYPLVTSQTFTLSNDSALSYAGYWSCISGVRDLEDSVIASGAGNSATAAVTRSYPDTSASYYEIQVIGNNAAGGALGGQDGGPGAAVATGAVNGNLALGLTARMATGSAVSYTTSGAMGGSMPWAVIALPFLAANQNSQAVPITTATSGYTGTSGVWTNNTNGPAMTNMDAGAGYILVKILAAAAATYTVTDSGSGGSNSYTQLKTQAVGALQMYVFGAPVNHALTGAWTITASSATNQHFQMSALYIPGGMSADATGAASNGATGTAVSLTYPATTGSGDFQVLYVGYVNNGNLLSTPAWTNNVSGLQLSYNTTDATGPQETNYFVSQQIGAGTTAFTATLSGSVAWGAIVVSLVTPDYSGGGGSSGGIGGYGVDGTNGQSGGGPSYTFGGKGANGILGSAAGLLGAVPGGGGSGASLSAAGSQAGGNGGDGMIRVTYQPPLISFNDFLLHRPGQFAPADLVPLLPVPVSDPPDNREYTMPQTVAGRNARFGGTYTIMLCAASWDTPSSSRRLSVTINQYEYPGGPAVSVQATRTLTPATDIVNGYVSMGEVTLPIKQVDDSNTDGYFTASIHDTNQTDSFQDLMFLDSQGQTCLVNIAPGTAGDSHYVNYYYDEPGLSTDLGKLLGSSHERDRAISVLDMAMVTGGPLYIMSGDNLLLAYSSKGAPNLKVTYSPHWYSDRIL